MTPRQVDEAMKDGAAVFMLTASMEVKGKAITEKIGEVAYRIALPPMLANLHEVFHVSQLRKYIADPSHVIQVDDVQVKDNLTVETLLVRIEDRKLKQLRGKEIALVRVAWGGAASGNVTWELESKMKDSYHELFA
ncbi:uncharacterized protein LOC131599086 [Vicia villosa]|uniref:uncharacterized protein LOC131599086 n=1 Tax=Vicia villosa TaxID=3911 RepID=UPI00273AE67B|nr:uncharacterized protein LOC131599086 [Vicia villosa]